MRRAPAFTNMPKTIFDLGSNNTFDTWDWFRPHEDSCRESFLHCVNNHHPWNCKRRAILEEHMWTRPR